jgi:hypothetical protein
MIAIENPIASLVQTFNFQQILTLRLACLLGSRESTSTAVQLSKATCWYQELIGLAAVAAARDDLLWYLALGTPVAAEISGNLQGSQRMY